MANRKSYTVHEAMKKLESYCAYQERCHQEVVKKLKSMHMIPVAIDKIIVHLIEQNYLNEERFAKNYARGKFNIKKWGRNRITNELKRRQISSYNIQMALNGIDEELYLKTFHELAKKRWGQLHGKNVLAKKKKLADYLFYRGWESHLVYEKVSELTSVNTD